MLSCLREDWRRRLGSCSMEDRGGGGETAARWCCSSPGWGRGEAEAEALLEVEAEALFEAEAEAEARRHGRTRSRGQAGRSVFPASAPLSAL
jgi:hypothetical protein